MCDGKLVYNYSIQGDKKKSLETVNQFCYILACKKHMQKIQTYDDNITHTFLRYV